MAAETFDSILSDIKKRKFAPVYFFCGEEAFFIDELTKALEDNVLNDMEKAFNQTIAYGKDLNARQIVETCGRLPMMAERQVVIIKEAHALNLKQEEEEQYLRYLKNPVKSTVLVFAWKHGTPDGRKSFGKEMKKVAVYFESKPLYSNQVAPWVKSWLTAKKYKIEDQAADLLVEYTGTELSKVANELEKLIINKQPGSTITLDDIESGVGVSKEYNVFELNNALGLKDKTKAFQIANYFVANPKNGPLVMVVATLQGFFNKVYLAHQFKNVLDKDLAGVLKVSPFFVKDYKAAAKNYSEKKLEQVFYILEEYDLRVKGVNNHSVKEGELMKEMVFRILNN
jgi:DNA polymerase-3 subunit delta